MSDYRLTRKEGNALYAYAESIGLQPSDFVLSFQKGAGTDKWSVLSHSPTEYWFRFGTAFSRTMALVFESTWSPLMAQTVSHQSTSREAQLGLAQTWLDVVKAEHETVDLWKSAADEKALIAGGPIDDGDRPFTREELKLLTARLTKLEEQIVVLARPNPEQSTHLSDTIQHAKDAATRTSRVDWKALFAGKLLDIIVSLSLDPGKAQQVLHYANLYIGPLVSRVIGLLS